MFSGGKQVLNSILGWGKLQSNMVRFYFTTITVKLGAYRALLFSGALNLVL
jgi:hypothetical protein